MPPGPRRAIAAIAALGVLGGLVMVAPPEPAADSVEVATESRGGVSAPPVDDTVTSTSSTSGEVAPASSTSSTRPSAVPTTTSATRRPPTTTTKPAPTTTTSGPLSRWPGPMGTKPKDPERVWEGRTTTGQLWTVSGFDPAPAGAETYGAYTVGVDGRNLRRLSTSFSELSWSPDGEWIASLGGPSITSPKTGQIIRLEALDPNRVPGRPHQEHGTPSWSPDSQQLAVAVNEDLTEPHHEHLVIVRIDGTTPRRLIPIPTSDAYNEAWLSDGRLVVLDSGGVWVVDSDGSDLRRVFSAPLGRGRLIPSPDGSTVVVTQWGRSDEPTQALLVDLAAGSSRPVCAENGVAPNRDPRWSPDGKRLLCPLLRDGREATAVWSVDTGALVVVDPSLGRPVWSPRGDLIAGFDSGTGDLVVEAPDGRGRRVLLSTSRPMTSLVWSPDGNQIAFALLP